MTSRSAPLTPWLTARRLQKQVAADPTVPVQARRTDVRGTRCRSCGANAAYVVSTVRDASWYCPQHVGAGMDAAREDSRAVLS